MLKVIWIETSITCECVIPDHPQNNFIWEFVRWTWHPSPQSWPHCPPWSVWAPHVLWVTVHRWRKWLFSRRNCSLLANFTCLATSDASSMITSHFSPTTGGLSQEAKLGITGIQCEFSRNIIRNESLLHAHIDMQLSYDFCALAVPRSQILSGDS